MLRSSVTLSKHKIKGKKKTKIKGTPRIKQSEPTFCLTNQFIEAWHGKSSRIHNGV